MALLCGRYEGFDERVHGHLADDEISIGRYVLAGGELPAMVVADVVMRKLPGALGHKQSAVEESFSRGVGGGAGVPALHAAAYVPGLAGARGAALRRPREGALLAARAEPRPSRAVRPRPRLDTIPPPRGVLRLGPAVFSRHHEQRYRQHRASPAEAGPSLLWPRRPRARPLPGGRGQPPPYPGLRGNRPAASGLGRARDLHGPQAVLRRRRGADVPAALAEDREARDRGARRRAPGQALLPARPDRQGRPRRGATLGHRRGAGLGSELVRGARGGRRRGRDARRRPRPRRAGARRGDRGRRVGGGWAEARGRGGGVEREASGRPEASEAEAETADTDAEAPEVGETEDSAAAEDAEDEEPAKDAGDSGEDSA